MLGKTPFDDTEYKHAIQHIQHTQHRKATQQVNYPISTPLCRPSRDQIKPNAKRSKDYTVTSWREGTTVLSASDFRVGFSFGLVSPTLDEAAHREKSVRALTFLSLVKS